LSYERLRESSLEASASLRLPESDAPRSATATASNRRCAGTSGRRRRRSHGGPSAWRCL